MKSELINFLNNKIQGCNELGGMEREIWAFKQVLKFINSVSKGEDLIVGTKEKSKKLNPEYCTFFNVCDDDICNSGAICENDSRIK